MKREVLSIRLTEEDKRKATEISRRQDRTLTAALVRLIRQAHAELLAGGES